VTPDKFRPQYTRPLVLGTRSHMLAMYVALDNANAMVCDYPEAYENQAGFEFIQHVPTTWEETLVLAARPDHYIIIARKKGEDWWIGCITGNAPETITVPFLFLKEGQWRADIYQDDLHVPFNPNAILINSAIVNPATVLQIPFAPGGGFVMKLKKQ
jgi:alpha-glucosidase